MTLDADNYRINVLVINQLTEELSWEDRIKFIGNLSIITGVPIIIVCVYIAELYGRTIELTNRQDRLMMFYRVNEILNDRSNNVHK